MTRFPFVSVVILTWNSKRDVSNLLYSINRADYPKNKYEIIVVDNASTDQTCSKIKHFFPRVQVIQLPKNLGMPAFNIGYKEARGELIFSIQSDVTVSKGFFVKVVEKFNRDPDIALLGVKVYAKDSHRLLPPTININFYTGLVTPVIIKNEGQKFDYLEGLVHIFPQKTLKKIGLIDKKYFFYGDDPDFSLRIKKKGGKIVYFPDTFVYHGKSKSTPTYFPLKYHYYYKATFSIIYTYGNLPQKIVVTIFQLFIAPFYLLVFKKRNTLNERWWGFWWNFKNSRFETKILILSFFLGLFFRIYALISHDFWFDEAFTYHIAKLPLKTVFEAVLTDNNPPLYYTLMHFWLKVNSNEVFLRLPSLLFNLATILLLFKITQRFNEAPLRCTSERFLSEIASFRRLHPWTNSPRFSADFNKKAASLAAALFSLSPLTVYLATTARLHSMAIFFISAMCLSFLKLFEKPDFKYTILFVLVSILGLYTQFYVILIFFPLTLFLLVKKPQLRSRWFVILMIEVILFIPWLFFSIQTPHNGCSCPNSILSLPASLASPTLGGIGEVTLRNFPKLPWYYLFLFIPLTIVSLVLFLKGLIKSFYLSLVYGIPLILLSGAGFFIPIFSPKGFSVYSPVFLMIMALGLASFKSKKLILICLFLLSSTSLIQLTGPFFNGIKIKPIIQIINSNPKIPIAHTSSLTFYSTYFYTKRENILLTKNLFSPQTIKYIGGKKENITAKEFWLVDTNIWTDDKESQVVKNEINRKFINVKKFKTGQAEVTLMQKR
ncbi:glycosyltransferase [Candidatus Daviesbacteria bacterium]|nr:glycosyltransferase [Candidatus Daviesbacteria bacterium]